MLADWFRNGSGPGSLQQRAGVAAVPALRRYALRYVACAAALAGDFCSVVDELVPYTTVAEAFEAAVRVKRGLIDTARPGGFVKDQAYFGGTAEVTAHLAAQPGDYELLMATKWPVGRGGLLRELREAGLLREPVYRAEQAQEIASALLPE